MPWEPITFIFRGYNPYFAGVQPSFSMGFGVQGYELLWIPCFVLQKSCSLVKLSCMNIALFF